MDTSIIRIELFDRMVYISGGTTVILFAAVRYLSVFVLSGHIREGGLC